MADFDDALCWIQKQYFQAVGMRYFDWDKLKSVNQCNAGSDTANQKAVLDATVLHPLSEKYPSSNAYKLSFLKSVLAVYEDRDWVSCDELYSLIAELMAKRNDLQDDFTYKSYILPCGKAITLCEAIQFVSQGTTGLNTWQAGLYLSNWLIQNKSVVQGKKVLELGCGVGLTGLVALHCCRPKTYIFTDCHEKVLRKVKENLQTNGFCLTKTEQASESCPNRYLRSVDSFNAEKQNCFSSEATGQDHCAGVLFERRNSRDEELNLRLFMDENDVRESCFEERMSVSEELRSSASSQCLEACRTCSMCERSVAEQCSAVVCQLDWEKLTMNEIERFSPDVILASDVIFDPKLIEPLVNVTKALLSHKGQHRKPVAYFASTIRNKDTYEKFLFSLDQSSIKQNRIPPVLDNFILYDTTSEIVILRMELSSPA